MCIRYTKLVLTPVVLKTSDIPDRLIKIANTNVSIIHGVSAYASETWDGMCDSKEHSITTMKPLYNKQQSKQV